jgi:hypothetical protein
MRGDGGESLAYIFRNKEWVKGLEIFYRTADGDINTHQDLPRELRIASN